MFQRRRAARRFHRKGLRRKLQAASVRARAEKAIMIALVVFLMVSTAFIQ
jgi:hypothetical protein